MINLLKAHLIKGKLQKKVLLLLVGPLREGEGEGPAIKEEKLLKQLFKIFCCHLRIQIILL